MQSIIEFCRELRQRETLAEKSLWDQLRNRKLFKHKFLRQYPICVSAFGYNRYYIPDFYCHKAKLVIEADGPIHLLKKEYDKNRDEVLAALGLTILRFENDEILNNTQSVLNKIKEHLILYKIPQPSFLLAEERVDQRSAVGVSKRRAFKTIHPFAPLSTTILIPNSYISYYQ